MDEYPGDTLGNRFLTFWGVFGAFAAVALLLGVYRWIAIPSDDSEQDGGAALQRAAVVSGLLKTEEQEVATSAEVEPGKSVRLPASAVIPWAAATLSQQKAVASAVKTPEGAIKEAEEKAKSVHDPNLSLFEGK